MKLLLLVVVIEGLVVVLVFEMLNFVIGFGFLGMKVVFMSLLVWFFVVVEFF